MYTHAPTSHHDCFNSSPSPRRIFTTQSNVVLSPDVSQAHAIYLLDNQDVEIGALRSQLAFYVAYFKRHQEDIVNRSCTPDIPGIAIAHHTTHSPPSEGHQISSHLLFDELHTLRLALHLANGRVETARREQAVALSDREKERNTLLKEIDTLSDENDELLEAYRLSQRRNIDLERELEGVQAHQVGGPVSETLCVVRQGAMAALQMTEAIGRVSLENSWINESIALSEHHHTALGQLTMLFSLSAQSLAHLRWFRGFLPPPATAAVPTPSHISTMIAYGTSQYINLKTYRPPRPSRLLYTKDPSKLSVSQHFSPVGISARQRLLAHLREEEVSRQTKMVDDVRYHSGNGSQEHQHRPPLSSSSNGPASPLYAPYYDLGHMTPIPIDTSDGIYSPTTPLTAPQPIHQTSHRHHPPTPSSTPIPHRTPPPQRPPFTSPSPVLASSTRGATRDIKDLRVEAIMKERLDAAEAVREAQWGTRTAARIVEGVSQCDLGREASQSISRAEAAIEESLRRFRDERPVEEESSREGVEGGQEGESVPEIETEEEQAQRFKREMEEEMLRDKLFERVTKAKNELLVLERISKTSGDPSMRQRFQRQMRAMHEFLLEDEFATGVSVALEEEESRCRSAMNTTDEEPLISSAGDHDQLQRGGAEVKLPASSYSSPSTKTKREASAAPVIHSRPFLLSASDAKKFEAASGGKTKPSHKPRGAFTTLSPSRVRAGGGSSSRSPKRRVAAASSPITSSPPPQSPDQLPPSVRGGSSSAPSHGNEMLSSGAEEEKSVVSATSTVRALLREAQDELHRESASRLQRSASCVADDEHSETSKVNQPHQLVAE